MYFDNKVYYKLIKLEQKIDNPDQRIVAGNFYNF
jgi:ABC-type uncharacterized transport system fused permease/ATPase subunit